MKVNKILRHSKRDKSKNSPSHCESRREIMDLAVKDMGCIMETLLTSERKAIIPCSGNSPLRIFFYDAIVNQLMVSADSDLSSPTSMLSNILFRMELFLKKYHLIRFDKSACDNININNLRAAWNKQLRFAVRRYQDDYYTLTLRWSPADCHDSERSLNTQQCGLPLERAYHFILHEFLPSKKTGASLTYCSNEKLNSKSERESIYSEMLPIMPGKRSIDMQWKKYGSCTSLHPILYFKIAMDSFHHIRIPHVFNKIDKPLTMTVEAMKDAFITVNPDLRATPNAIQPTGEHGDLLDVKFCLHKASFDFVNCPSTSVTLTPQDELTVLPPTVVGAARSPTRIKLHGYKPDKETEEDTVETMKSINASNRKDSIPTYFSANFFTHKQQQQPKVSKEWLIHGLLGLSGVTHQSSSSEIAYSNRTLSLR